MYRVCCQFGGRGKTRGTGYRGALQEIGGLQVLPDDGIQHHTKHDLDVGRVGGRGEVGVDDLALVEVAFHELILDEPAGRVHVSVWTYKTGQTPLTTGHSRTQLGHHSQDTYIG